MNESTRSTLRFLLVFFGVLVLLAGAVMWVGLRDYDHHYTFEETSESMPDDWNDDSNPVEGAGHQEEYATYGELTDRQRDIFERAVDGERFVFQSASELPPTLVEKDGTFYLFSYHRSFDWTDPGMAGATATLLVGLWLTFEGIRREQFAHVPVYALLYRKLTAPVRRLRR